MVEDGRVRWEDKDGQDAADRVADLGRRRQPEHGIDARRRIQNASSVWYLPSPSLPLPSHPLLSHPFSIIFVICIGFSLFLHGQLWARGRLGIELAVSNNRRKRRIVPVWAVPFGPGIEIWRSCRFLGSMFRALTDLPGGMGRFLPCTVGGGHC